MIYLLDTNAISDLMRADARIENWISALDRGDRVVTCTVVRGEILFGIARLPDGRRRAELEQAGHLIASTAKNRTRVKKLIQETAFNNYDDLRRLYIVMISQDNRELTAAARSMLDHKVPARVSVTIGQIENRLFVPKEERPPQAQWRTA